MRNQAETWLFGQATALALPTVLMSLSGDLYHIACGVLMHLSIVYAIRRAVQPASKSTVSDKRVHSQRPLPNDSSEQAEEIPFSALLWGLYTVACAGTYLVLYRNDLVFVVWDYTNESEQNVFMFRFTGYMMGFIFTVKAFQSLERLGSSFWRSVGLSTALAGLGISFGGLVSLYLPILL